MLFCSSHELKCCKPHKAARHPTKRDIKMTSNNFPQYIAYHRIYCRKFLTLSNQMLSYKNKCIRILICDMMPLDKYRSTSLSQSPREWRKNFELSKGRHKQNVTSPKYDVHIQFLQDILLQYLCSQTVPTENRIEMKTKEIHFSLFYFHFNYVLDRHNATALARDKQYCGNGDF